jgi:hypothetical protein
MRIGAHIPPYNVVRDTCLNSNELTNLITEFKLIYYLLKKKKKKKSIQTKWVRLPKFWHVAQILKTNSTQITPLIIAHTWSIEVPITASHAHTCSWHKVVSARQTKIATKNRRPTFIW